MGPGAWYLYWRFVCSSDFRTRSLLEDTALRDVPLPSVLEPHVDASQPVADPEAASGGGGQSTENCLLTGVKRGILPTFKAASYGRLPFRGGVGG